MLFAVRESARPGYLTLAGMIVLVAGLNVAVYLLLPGQLQVPVFYSLACGWILLLLFLRMADQRSLAGIVRILESMTPLAVMRDSVFSKHITAVSNSVLAISRQPDPILRQFALKQIDRIERELAATARGRIVFSSTEGWRDVYENLLSSLEVRVYYSVAWMTSLEYWNNEPGRQSIRFNIELAERGFRIERIVILPDELWEYDATAPCPEVRQWIDRQRQYGIDIRLVREHELRAESDLPDDFGIYGSRATGRLELNEDADTLRFTFDFDACQVRAAMDRWQRLGLYAVPADTLWNTSQC